MNTIEIPVLTLDDYKLMRLLPYPWQIVLQPSLLTIPVPLYADWGGVGRYARVSPALVKSNHVLSLHMYLLPPFKNCLKL